MNLTQNREGRRDDHVQLISELVASIIIQFPGDDAVAHKHLFLLRVDRFRCARTAHNLYETQELSKIPPSRANITSFFIIIRSFLIAIMVFVNYFDESVIFIEPGKRINHEVHEGHEEKNREFACNGYYGHLRRIG